MKSRTVITPAGAARAGGRAELLAQLSDRARQEGICRFTALTGAENKAVAALLRKAGARLVRRGPGTRRVRDRIYLPGIR
jgi:hypothetical protein